MKTPAELAFEYKKAEEARAYQETHTAGEAKAVLEMPAFQRAVERVRQGIWIAFKSTPPTDEKGLAHVRAKLDVIEEILFDLTEQKRKGDEAERELGKIEKARDWIKRRGYLDR